MMQIDGREIGPDHEPYLIAELSGEHMGDIKRGWELMDAAHDAGADAVKLQCYTADSLTFRGEGEEFKVMAGPWKGQTLHDLYSVTQTTYSMLEKLIRYGQRKGLTVFASVFDLEGVDFLESLKVPAYKIASFELTDIPLIAKAAQTKKPMIISTGMGTRSEIIDAINVFNLYGKQDHLGVLHCVSEYPASPSEANLPALGPLSSLLGGRHVVGLSDHTLGVGVSAAAVAFGGCIIEKHITLDRSHAGPDGSFSLEPAEFAALVKACNEAWQATRSFIPKARPAFLPYRKSLYVVKDVSCGDSFSHENCRSIRPAHGLAPKFYPSVLAGRATRDLKAGTPMSSDMVSTLCSQRDNTP